MGFAFFGVACGFGVVVLVLLVASALLRLAITLANKVVKPTKTTRARTGGIAEWDWDEWDEWDEVEAEAEPVRPWRTKPTIPEPGTFKSMAIVFGTACAFTIGFILTGVMATEMGFRMWREDTKLAVTILNLPVAALALTTLLAWTLPTGFWRGAMVTFIYGFVMLAFVLFIVCTVFFVSRIR